MATENDTLRDQMRQTEKDTIDVVSFLKKQDLDKDTEVNYIILNSIIYLFFDSFKIYNKKYKIFKLNIVKIEMI